MFGEPVRERLRALERRELVGLAIVAVLVVAGVAFWYVRSLPASVTVHALGEEATGGLVPARASPTPWAPVVVYVTGWVHRPGVYEFRQGDRVIDAIRRAGGAREGADLTSINLAALLTDGEQIIVAKKGAAPAGGPSSGVVTGSGSTSGSGGEVVNLNTATLDQLETLPGIGPALGQRIIDYREEHGPFGSVDDLLNVSGIGEKRLEDIRSKVTV